MSSQEISSQPTLPSSRVAEFITNLTYNDLPEEVVGLIERCFVDTVGVMTAGSSATAGTRVKEMITSEYNDGAATIFGHNEQVPSSEAVLVNGTATHADDYDDVSDGMDGHPSATMVAPILALGESIDASGREMITAYAAGFETQCYLAAPNLRGRSGSGLHIRGWHPTAVFGTFGATAAAASLLGLSQSETKQSINLAASMPAGLKQNFGSLSKPVHVGRSGAAGVRAAKLAVNGVTADKNAIQDGFFPVYLGVESGWEATLHSLGDRWGLVEDGIDMKKYPCCYGAHTAIYATSLLADQHNIIEPDIDQIHLTISSTMDDLLAHDDPTTEEQAKFSVPYTAAIAVLYDHIGIESFKPETIQKQEVQSLCNKVTYEVEPSYPTGTPCKTTVSIETVDGECYSITKEEPPGTQNNPLSDSELKEKFMKCTTRAVDETSAISAYNYLAELRELSTVHSLSEVLSG
jgi:2-methylcitrate dehydratase PrpD